MAIEIKIPSPGESISEVEMATWNVNDGDYVEKDQEIGEIESDKATLPLIADTSGTIKILIQEGDVAPVGAVACTIEEGAGAPAKKAATESDTEPEKTEEPKVEKEEEKPKSESSSDKTHVKMTPLAKAMMEDNDLTMDDVLNGLHRITKKDIEAVISLPKEEAKPASQSTAKSSRDEDRKKMTNLRKKLSQRLVAVKQETAMLTTFNEVDMSNVMDMRNKYKEAFLEKYGVKLGFMSFFTKAASEALKLHPMVNSRIEGEEIVTPSFTDIGIAVSTPKGLMVPIVRDVDKMGIGDTEKEIARLASVARDGKLSIDDMSGGTFTITNGGVFGSLLSTPIINPPQSGILGMHNIVERPVAVNGEVVIRPMMYIALSYDHRIIDGKDSVGFLVKLKQYIENPEKMLFGL